MDQGQAVGTEMAVAYEGDALPPPADGFAPVVEPLGHALDFLREQAGNYPFRWIPRQEIIDYCQGAFGASLSIADLRALAANAALSIHTRSGIDGPEYRLDARQAILLTTLRRMAAWGALAGLRAMTAQAFAEALGARPASRTSVSRVGELPNGEDDRILASFFHHRLFWQADGGASSVPPKAAFLPALMRATARDLELLPNHERDRKAGIDMNALRAELLFAALLGPGELAQARSRLSQVLDVYRANTKKRLIFRDESKIVYDLIAELHVCSATLAFYREAQRLWERATGESVDKRESGPGRDTDQDRKPRLPQTAGDPLSDRKRHVLPAAPRRTLFAA
jgi:hypothetical protein